MTKKAEKSAAKPGKKITRRQMLKGVGIVTAPQPVPQLQPQGTINGTVKYPWGIVKNAKVVIGERYGFADGDGKYEITGAAPGKHAVTAQAPFPGYEVQVQEIDIGAGETKTVDFYLDFEKAVVDGHVYDQDGQPIAGAILDGVRSGKDMETRVTDDKGYFKFERATPGNLFVRVNAAGHMGEIRDFVAKKGEKTELEFRLVRGTCKISGIVTDKTGRPLHGELRAQLTSGLILMKTISNEDTGHYEFSVLPETYDIVAAVDGYQAEVRRESISEDTEVNFKLTPLSELPPMHYNSESY
jgi:hypothetical protein